jgi:transcriptional regulator GlxA family with amidase domain
MNAVFMFPPQVHLLDITGPAHVFYEALSYGADVKLNFSSIFKDESDGQSSCKLYFAALVPFDQLELERGDLIFVPGLDSSLLLDSGFLNKSHPFQNWLTVQYERGVIVCSVCTGAFLLANSGLLNERSCTTHWKYAEIFKQRYPKVNLLTNRLFVESEQIFTSAGVSSGIDLALHLVEKLWGGYFAAQIAKEIVIYFRRTMDDPQLNIFTQYRNHLEHRIHQVQDKLTHTLDHKNSLEEISEEIGMSSRNLTRLFKQATGVTVGQYLNGLRRARASQLIKEGHTRQAVADQCGLKSVNQLRSLLKEGK